MDNNYSEPFGLVLGSSLLVMQILDHEGVLSLAWNSTDHKHASHRGKEEADELPTLTSEVRLFLSNNFYLASGYAGGYLFGNVVADIFTSDIRANKEP